MSRRQARKLNRQRHAGVRKPETVAAAFLGLHVLLAFWRPNPFWGADLLYYYPDSLRIVFILLAILVLVPRVRARVHPLFAGLSAALRGNGVRPWIVRILLILVALAGFIALQSARHLLGDGYLYLRELDAGITQRVDRAPLTFALIRFVHEAGASLWQTAENTYRVYSYASGLLFLLLALATAGALGRTDREKTVVFAFLVTAGYVQLFFGYVENYAFYMPATLLYLLAGLRSLENRAPLYVPALVLGLLVPFHFLFVLFAPSLIILGYYRYRRQETSMPKWKNVADKLAAFCTAPLAAVLVFWIAGFDFGAFLERTGGKHHILPLFSEPGFHVPYRIVSLSHLLDFVNLQVLSAPAAVMAVFLFGGKDYRHHPFLLSAAAVPLFFTFLANPEIGAFRDWDILALPALPLTLWAASALLERRRQDERDHRSVSVICAAAALHTMLWIGLNANPAAAEARYVHLMGRLNGHAASYGWETLGTYYRLRGKTVPALNAYKRALDANPQNPRHWLSVGIIYCDLGRPERGIDHLRRATEIQPDLAEAHINLGAAYLGTGRHGVAIDHLRKATELQPETALTYVNLGAAYNETDRHSEALDVLNKALEIQPEHPGAHVNLGASYHGLGRYEEAVEHLKTALELQPALANAQTYLNIGGTYHSMGRFEEAIPYLQKAIQINPRFTNAYFNLGLAYGALNRMEEARANLRKVLELNPDDPQAPVIRQLLRE
ncbi:MAG: tetratricopeptide repeat protein [Candidatus Latescibacteria bacterium]|nr:tetratricopeptide repeat protein [Candidatus Latescibacterota bacterium]